MPTFPNLTEQTNLSQLVGPNSWLLFRIFGQQGTWLKRTPQSWEENCEFNEMKTFVKNLKIVNDAAERGIKLIQDFSQSITEDENERQALLQSVEQSRKKTPTFQKRVLKNL